MEPCWYVATVVSATSWPRPAQKLQGRSAHETKTTRRFEIMHNDQMTMCGKRTCDWVGLMSSRALRKDSENSETSICPKCGTAAYWIERPLFIPLRREYFQAFARGEKQVEYRLNGKRWNAITCRKGRAVVLSCGYSGPRLHGVITDVTFLSDPGNEVEGWRDCYGLKSGKAICIWIGLST